MNTKLLCYVAFAAIAALSAIAPATAADKLILTQTLSPTAAVSSVGVAKGYFTEQAIDFDNVWTTRGTEAIQALSADQAHLAIMAVTPAIAARAQGLPVVIVGLHSHGFSGYFVASKKNAHLTRLEDPVQFARQSPMAFWYK